MTEPFVLPETAAVIELLNAQEGPHLSELPAADMRAVYLQLGEAFDEPADSTVRTADFVGDGIPLRAYFPNKAQAGPVIVYMHGGGWVIGDLESHHSVCAQMALISGMRVVSVDYRLAPEHPFPAAHDDCLAAARFVASSPAELEAPVTGIAVAGDSAGGNLAFHVAATLGAGGVLAQLLIYPVGDCTSPEAGSYKDFEEGYLLDRRLMDRFITDYLPTDDVRKHRAASPLLYPLPTDLPPTVIMTAGLDPLRDQGRALAAHLPQQGVEVHFLEAAGLIHGIATMRKAFPTGDHIIVRAVGLFADAIDNRQSNEREEFKA
ncbi:MAG: alpha/beta hydrolase [Novosphingobium sp.]|nr:alpha/beta hydrolase [Novosphingobium sp.]